ncbi:histidine phosphatase family protein [Streptosporangium canum]|uniref:histidine phosphatase family protein n=1 Tax=Streptosporangium canum TaxID=324952 RepID=UPI003429584E
MDSSALPVNLSFSPVTVDLAELSVVRHGQSAANAAFAAAEATGALDSGITGQDQDVPLSVPGHRQAAQLGTYLVELPAGQRPEVVLCSPYLRARQTLQAASAVAAGRGVSLPMPRFDDRLRDRVMGELELLTAAAIEARFPHETQRRRSAGEFHYKPPGGESFGDVAARLGMLLEELHQRYLGRRVLLVAHDAVVLMLRRLIEGLSWQELGDVVQAGPVANASVTRWRQTEGRLQLIDYNRTDHL